MVDHTVTSFDQELNLLDQKIAEMGDVAEKMLSDAMEALSNFDADRARAVIDADMRLDILQRNVEEQAIETISRRQPMACDLRSIIAAMRISSDLERVGDLAKNVAKRVLKISPELLMPRCVIGLWSMHELASRLLRDAVDAYVQRDLQLAHAVWIRDVDLDNLDDAVFRDLLTFMMEDQRSISFCAHLLFCSKNLERVGDHATNIAETVIYLVSGQAAPIDRPKGGEALSDSGGQAASAAPRDSTNRELPSADSIR